MGYYDYFRRKTPENAGLGGDTAGNRAAPRCFFPPAPPQQPQKVAGNSAWGGQRLELLLAHFGGGSQESTSLLVNTLSLFISNLESFV